MKTKEIKYNGFKIFYDDYCSMIISNNCYEVILSKDKLIVATLMLNKNQLEKI